MKRVVAVAGLALAVGCGGKKPAATVGSGPDALPKLIVSYVNGRWPNAKVEPPAASCAATAGASNAFVTGDFSGDGQMDYAIRVAATDGVHLVEAIARTKEFGYYSVPLAGDLANGVLGVKKRGERFVSDLGVPDFLGLDTPTVTPCGQTTTTGYFWIGAGVDPRKIT